MKVEVYEIELIGGPEKGKVQEWKKGCKCEDIKLAKEAEKNHQKSKMRKFRNMFEKNSLISRDLQGATFDNYEAKTEKQEYAKRVAKRYAEVFERDNPKNILFFGSFGLGKSHLAKAITDDLIKKEFTTIFISIPKLLRKIRATYNKESDVKEDDIITILEKVDCLILDDLGAEKTSDWTMERVFDIVDSRQGKHTVYTTNYEPDDLINRLGERNFSRVINRETTVLEIDGNNYRLENFGG